MHRQLTQQRISQLTDMIVCHLIRNRTYHALLIAQYLRRQTGMSLVLGFWEWR